MKKDNLIQPRTLKGFRDFFGKDLKQRKNIFKIFEETFEKYGYEPLETPVLEYYDILAGKYGEEEKLIYNFSDFGGRRVGMKYDLTVPATRFFAQNRGKFKLPWRRYQMQQVWRADNTQSGRYRELYQLDADIFGVASPIADAELIQMGIDIIKKLGFCDFNIQLNNRKILNAICIYATGNTEKFYDVVFAIDKWDKRTIEETRTDLLGRGLSNDQMEKVMKCINTTDKDSLEKLDTLAVLFKDIPEGIEGISELKQIFDYLSNNSVLQYDPTIARGLAYYTGPIWEMKVKEGNIGSIGGAGRYDNLVESMTGESIPATGGSFGIERIIQVMSERDMLSIKENNNRILMTISKSEYIKLSFEMASKIRSLGYEVIFYPEARQLGKQLDFADKTGIKWVVILGEEEISKKMISVKNMDTGEQKTILLSEIDKIRTLFN